MSDQSLPSCCCRCTLLQGQAHGQLLACLCICPTLALALLLALLQLLCPCRMCMPADEPDDHAPGSPSRASGDGSVFSSGSGPTLLTKSGSGRGMTAAARWRLGANMARAGDRGAEGARDTSVMHETTLMETLGKKVGHRLLLGQALVLCADCWLVWSVGC